MSQCMSQTSEVVRSKEKEVCRISIAAVAILLCSSAMVFGDSAPITPNQSAVQVAGFATDRIPVITQAPQQVRTADGHRVAVFQAIPANELRPSAELRDGPEEYTLLDASGASYFGVSDWYQLYDIAQPAVAAAYGISHIEFAAGSRDGDRVPTEPSGQGDGYWLTHDRYILFELYDTHLCDAPAYPVTCQPIGPMHAIHQTYLGGILFDLGPHGAAHGSQDFQNWIADAGANSEIYSLYTPVDGQLVVYVRMGELIGDVFSPVDYRAEVSGLSMLYSTDSAGGVYNTGTRVDGTLFADGFDTASDGFDRILTDGDGPLVFGGQKGVLGLILRGRPLWDCNNDDFPDAFELACGAAGAYGGCLPDGCEWFANVGTTGFFNAYYYADPLATAGLESICMPAGEDADSSGLLDECEDYSPDCDSDGILDVCELSCDFPCNYSHPGECGTETNCNYNFVPDNCDIAAGTSTDCNENGTPDECETISNGDFNADGHVTITDYTAFAQCMGGPNNQPVPPEACYNVCLAAFDADADDDIDLHDFMYFIEQFEVP